MTFMHAIIQCWNFRRHKGHVQKTRTIDDVLMFLENNEAELYDLHELLFPNTDNIEYIWHQVAMNCLDDTISYERIISLIGFSIIMIEYSMDQCLTVFEIFKIVNSTKWNSILNAMIE